MTDKIITYPMVEDVELRKVITNSVGYNSLSSEEKQVLYFMNYARKNPALFLKNAINVFLVNHREVVSDYTKGLQKTFQSLPPLSIVFPDSLLSTISRAHAKDLSSHNTISHTSSNGKTFQQRVQPYVKECAAECINATQRFDAIETVLSLLFDFNVPDLGHRKTMLDKRFGKAGLGYSKSSKGNNLVVIDFSCK